MVPKIHEVYKTTTKWNSTGLLKMVPQKFQQEKLLDFTKINYKKNMNLFDLMKGQKKPH